MSSLLSIIEIVATFGLFIAFCLWQLYDLKKMDDEDADKNSSDKKDEL